MHGPVRTESLRKHGQVMIKNANLCVYFVGVSVAGAFFGAAEVGTAVTDDPEVRADLGADLRRSALTTVGLATGTRAGSVTGARGGVLARLGRYSPSSSLSMRTGDPRAGGV